MSNLVHRSEQMQLLCKDDEELMKLVIIIHIKFCCNCFFGTKFCFIAVYFVLLQFQYFEYFVPRQQCRAIK